MFVLAVAASELARDTIYICRVSLDIMATGFSQHMRENFQTAITPNKKRVRKHYCLNVWILGYIIRGTETNLPASRQ